MEAKPFSLPNPGGGRDLLESASFTLVRGRIYGLIGRNGKGKSTLLRAIASRSVGDIPREARERGSSRRPQWAHAWLFAEG